MVESWLDNFAHSYKVADQADQNQQHAQQSQLCTDLSHGAFLKPQFVAQFVVDMSNYKFY